MVLSHFEDAKSILCPASVEIGKLIL